MLAVDNIIEGRTDRSNIWDVNTEEEDHESKSALAARASIWTVENYGAK